jgi:hypothetical protein
MRALAVDENRWLFYEGTDTRYGYSIWPAPAVSAATVLADREAYGAIPSTNYLYEVPMVFREDSFDPATRIRRGRLYKESAQKPEDWQVQPHPAHAGELLEAQNNGGKLPRRLVAFYAWPAARELGGRLGSVLIALGTRDAFTLWRIVDMERIVTGEDLLTLRARSALGVLPELNPGAIPPEDLAGVAEVLERLSRAAYTADPESVVQLARDAAQRCLAAWIAERRDDPGIKQMDLRELGRLLKGRKNKSLIKLLARLQARAKPDAQAGYGARAVQQGDAEFALAAVGMLLRELGWAL